MGGKRCDENLELGAGPRQGRQEFCHRIFLLFYPHCNSDGRIGSSPRAQVQERGEGKLGKAQSMFYAEIPLFTRLHHSNFFVSNYFLYHCHFLSSLPFSFSPLMIRTTTTMRTMTKKYRLHIITITFTATTYNKKFQPYRCTPNPLFLHHLAPALHRYDCKPLLPSPLFYLTPPSIHSLLSPPHLSACRTYAKKQRCIFIIISVSRPSLTLNPTYRAYLPQSTC